MPEPFYEYIERESVPVRYLLGRDGQDRPFVHTPDLKATKPYQEGVPFFVANVDLGAARTALSVPLSEADTLVGVFTLVRQEVRPFTANQIAVVQNFAAQAVIAIQNARLFERLEARTRELAEALRFQTATSDVLKAISRSPDALQPVLDVIVETSRELCGSDGSTIFLLRDGKFYVTALAGPVPSHLEYLRANPISADAPGSSLSRVLRKKRSLHYPNVLDDPELREGSSGLGGPRALLTVPLIRENQVVGAIVLRQSHLTPFTNQQIKAIETFADQAVIAISNVNLFEEVQQRTREVSQSLDKLRLAQDRLVHTEKLASLGQLTAGIAHEIKNPLNFVNNFTSLSKELTAELKQLLDGASLDASTRTDVMELFSTLTGNLDKVSQHGQRADSIVKNMLLHSREGTGEHRPVAINALAEESLNLAYHGARAERPDFNVTLGKELDPTAGEVDIYPQEVMRVLLNLISNAFYASAKRKSLFDDPDFTPALLMRTRNLGSSVEIRIRDNGIGITEEVREKIFNPFFTTKPAGEGTGLGLSISHDIIVKQHGGRLDVSSVPGSYTEFVITLPRSDAQLASTGARR